MSGRGKRAGPEPYLMYLQRQARGHAREGARAVEAEGTTEEPQGRKLLGQDGDRLSSEGRRGKTQVRQRDALTTSRLESLEPAGHCSQHPKQPGCCGDN